MGKNGKIPALRWFGRFGRDRRGNISTMVALLIVPLVGVMGVATETGNWFAIQRSAQNAADSAVIAAATNATGTSAVANQTYVTEGRSVASNFGFTNGANSTTVAVTYPDNSVPTKCNSKCYAVTITRTVPVYMNRIIGWASTQTVTAKSVAISQVTPTSYCLVSLGTSGTGFQVNGGHSVNLNGCNVLSNGDVTCNGSNSNGGANSITYGPSGSNKKCSPSTQESSVFVDPYAALSSNIPADNCMGVYPQEPTKKNQSALPSSNTLGGNIDWSSQTLIQKCGDVQLSSNVNITTASPGTVLVIYNGMLDLASYKLAATGGLTIIFSGSNSGGYSHIPTGGTLLDFSAPTSGTWKGVALMQDSALTNGVDMSAAGNSPGWNISGLIYVPNSNLSFSGTVNKAASGLDCFVLIDKNFASAGTGNILESQSQCAQQGVTLPSANDAVRTSLVF